VNTRRATRRYTTGEAVADALDQLAPRIRDGRIVGLSIEWAPTGTIRVTYIIAPGVDVAELELAGVAEEADEHAE
jgi:hypothetical protein